MWKIKHKFNHAHIDGHDTGNVIRIQKLINDGRRLNKSVSTVSDLFTWDAQPEGFAFWQMVYLLYDLEWVDDTEFVKLNDEYTAILTTKEVKVGCQTFPLEVIDLLVEAKNEVLKQSKNTVK